MTGCLDGRTVNSEASILITADLKLWEYIIMIETTLDNLGQKLKARRDKRGLRITAKEIGISPATLSRIERGKMPELLNFAKICNWLQVDPGEVLKNKRIFMPKANLTKEDYAYVYECIERTIQLARLRDNNNRAKT